MQHYTYDVVLWANANSRETLVTDFAAIAELIGLPEKNAQTQSAIGHAVKRWIKNNPAWLLILDNADEIEVAGNAYFCEPTNLSSVTNILNSAGELSHRR